MYEMMGIPHGVVAKVLDLDIVVIKFELQSRYYVPLPRL